MFLQLGSAILAATLGVTACGTTADPTSKAGAGGSGTGGGHGGHGGSSAKHCPASPPQNLDSCAGFAVGDQCNYGSSSSGTLSSTECQCTVATDGQVWSCGTEGAGVGSSGSSSSG